MQNGNDYIGARRALLFAHDFNLDLDKALKYDISFNVFLPFIFLLASNKNPVTIKKTKTKYKF